MDVFGLAWTFRSVHTEACISNLSFDIDEWCSIDEHTISLCCWLIVHRHLGHFQFGIYMLCTILHISIICVIYILIYTYNLSGSVFLFLLSKCLGARLLVHSVCNFTARLSATIAVLVSIPNSSLKRCPGHSTPLSAGSIASWFLKSP